MKLLKGLQGSGKGQTIPLSILNAAEIKFINTNYDICLTGIVSIEIISMDLKLFFLLSSVFPHDHQESSYYSYLLKKPFSNIHPFQKGRKKSIPLIDWWLFSHLPSPPPPPPPQFFFVYLYSKCESGVRE